MIKLIMILQLALSCLGNSRDKQILSLCSTKRYTSSTMLIEVMNSKIKFYDDDSSSSDEDGLDP